MSVAPDPEMVEAYALASKGNKMRAFLLALNAGFTFDRVVGAMGDDGVRVAFQCLLKGWISEGAITDAGRAELAKGADG